MATATSKTHCVKCGKEKATMRCGGCLKEFCFKHLGDHRQDLNKEFDEIEVNRDLFRQSLTQHIEQPNNHTLIQPINQWEQNSIKIIQKTADEARQLLLKNTNYHIHQIETKLNVLTNQLRQSRDEDDFHELNLHQFRQELTRLTEELTKPSNILIREDSTSFISKIIVQISDNSITAIPKGRN
jgi:DNA helicase IV